MPRKKSSAATGAGAGASTTVSSSSSSSNNPILAPGGGTLSDISHLSTTLSLPTSAILAIMNCEGQGVVAVSGSRRGGGGGGASAAAAAAAAAGIDPTIMNVWGDFMSEEMETTTTTSPAVPSSTKTTTTTKSATSAVSSSASAAAAATNSSYTTTAPSGPRNYILPIPPRMRLIDGGSKKLSSSISKKNDANDDGYYDVPTPGLLAQTGTLDSSVPGRSSISKEPLPHELVAPTLLFPSIFGKTTKIAYIATSPTACHSIAITTTGQAYGWGRNETGQLGLGYNSPVVPLPTLLYVESEPNLKFVGAAVGKYHTLLVGANGKVYGSGGNICGQLGINNMGLKGIDKFRKCVVVGQLSGKSEEENNVDEDAEEEDGVKIVQASCGENISALLSSTGHLYTAGASEFGQLGNGETGEYIISTGKVGFNNSGKFVRRSVFVQSEADRDGLMRTTMSSDAMDSSTGRVKCVTLEDSSQICLSSVSCGRNHILAVEAPTEGHAHVPRVFSWGCGDYGCLGHFIQADEYYPRMVGSFRGPIFANNHPVLAVVGSHCSLVLTRQGHVYYMGKHKTAGEATMRPTIVDALANNGHVVTAIGAGGQTVFCSTKGGVTVSWGHGSHGELGFGNGENKSSSQPKFVNGLDSCLVTSVSCGMGHTLFIIRNEDEEDAKALKKVGKVEEADVAKFVDQYKGTRGGADDADCGEAPAKKKSRSSKGGKK